MRTDHYTQRVVLHFVVARGGRCMTYHASTSALDIFNTNSSMA